MGRSRGEQLYEKVFYIVNQFNAGSSRILSREEKIEIAGLSLLAGRKAKSATAYSEALRYFSAGIGLLENDSWEKDYRLAYDLYFEKAECEYLNANFDDAFMLFDYVIDHAVNIIDRAKVYDKKVIIYTNMGSHRTGMECGLEALKLFGITIPAKPGRGGLVREIMKARILQGRRSVEDLMDSPEITDPEVMMIIILCINTGTAAYFIDNDIVALLAMKMVNHTLRYGNSKHSSIAFLSYALILGSGMGRYEDAYRFGMRAMELNEKYNNEDLKPRILFIFGFLISHWRKHYMRTIQLMERSYRVGIETGDINYAVFSAVNIIQFRIKFGHNLDQVFEEMAGYQGFVLASKNEEFIYELTMSERYILSQKSRTRSLSDYSDDGFNEQEFVGKIKKFRVTTYSY